MTSQEFVSSIRLVAFEAAVESTLKAIQKPPGRRPTQALSALASWYDSLDDSDKQFVRDAIALAARQATFGMFAVLDGVRQIEDPGDRGVLELRYVRNGISTLLNDPKAEFLHDLFNTKANGNQ